MLYVTGVETDLSEFDHELEEYRPIIEIYLKGGPYGHVRHQLKFFFFFAYISMMITFERGGEYKKLVSDFRRRKVIEIFELHDKEAVGALPIITIEKVSFYKQTNSIKRKKSKVTKVKKYAIMNLADKFYAGTELRKEAQNFIAEKTALSLPGLFVFFPFMYALSNYGEKKLYFFALTEFIQYSSLLIHPLLLEFHFKCAIFALGGKVDVHDGPLPAVFSETDASVLVPAVIGREKLSKQREHLFESDSEKEDDDDDLEDELWLGDENDTFDGDEYRNSGKVTSQNIVSKKKKRFVGVWRSKTSTTNTATNKPVQTVKEKAFLSSESVVEDTNSSVSENEMTKGSEQSQFR
ncbi:hypothetical protein RFI_18580 [Reticulomyxa filosa]|uniref:Uncharacterized protein n=1 Tax=Reticulomyxa filosa TaxID=46433 RepID=X6N027_RETFI|nr:hypothetical protein RFI_18580 [Reticulomyxa filosa]|eukprot:ETO18677.1 hypothetical protein RFI_18580 [Reticulomyxa filosa]